MIAIQDVRFYGKAQGNFLSYVSVILNGCLVLKHMRLVRSKREGNKLVLSMPCRQGADGEWKEFYHPIRKDAREMFERAVLDAYTKHLSEGSGEGPN